MTKKSSYLRRLCSSGGRPVWVLYRPLGPAYFTSRHAWGRRAAYASQFLDPIGRAWRTKAKVKAVLLGNEDPDGWGLPPKPTGMRWATYERWVARYDDAEEMLDAQLAMAVARLMKRVAGKNVWPTVAGGVGLQSLGRTGVDQALSVT